MQDNLKVNTKVLVGCETIERRQVRPVKVSRSRPKSKQLSAYINVKTSRVGDLIVAHINVNGMTNHTVNGIKNYPQG